MDYCTFYTKDKIQRRRGGQKKKGASRKGRKKKAHVVQRHSRILPALAGESVESRLAHWLTPDLSHASPCSRCKPSLLKLAHSTFIPYTHWKTTGKRSMKTQILFTFSPLLLKGGGLLYRLRVRIQTRRDRVATCDPFFSHFQNDHILYIFYLKKGYINIFNE